jgi:hypothetical protein
MGIEGQRTASIPEEPTAQLVGLFRLAARVRDRFGADDAGQPGHLGPVGPVELPGDAHRPLDQELFDVIARFEVIRPGVEPPLKRLGILAGQDERLGAQAMFDGVEPRAILSLGAPRPGALPSIPAVDLGPVRCGHGSLTSHQLMGIVARAEARPAHDIVGLRHVAPLFIRMPQL